MVFSFYLNPTSWWRTGREGHIMSTYCVYLFSCPPSPPYWFHLSDWGSIWPWHSTRPIVGAQQMLFELNYLHMKSSSAFSCCTQSIRKYSFFLVHPNKWSEVAELRTCAVSPCGHKVAVWLHGDLASCNYWLSPLQGRPSYLVDSFWTPVSGIASTKSLWEISASSLLLKDG